MLSAIDEKYGVENIVFLTDLLQNRYVDTVAVVVNSRMSGIYLCLNRQRHTAKTAIH